MKKLRFCKKCKEYTLKQECGKCKEKTFQAGYKYLKIYNKKQQPI